MRQVTKQHQEIYQARINDLIEQFESQLAKFRQELGLLSHLMVTGRPQLFLYRQIMA